MVARTRLRRRGLSLEMAGISAAGMQEAVTHLGLVIPSESLGTCHPERSGKGANRSSPGAEGPRADGSDPRLTRGFPPRVDLATLRPTRGLPGVPCTTAKGILRLRAR